MRSKKTPFPIQTVLRDHGALADLEKLAASGCNRHELLAFLSIASYADDSWPKLVGTKLRTYRRNIQEIEHCADLIDRLNRSRLIHRLSIEHLDPRFAEIHQPPTLPDQLRKYAHNLSYLPKLYGPKRKLSRHAWKALIVAKTIEDTGKPHDSEISALIAAVLDNRRYGSKAHQAWRLKHRELIEKMRDRPSNSAPTRLLSPPNS